MAELWGARSGGMRRNAGGGEGVCPPPQVHIVGANERPPMAEPWDERGQVLAPARRDGLLTMMTPVFPDNETLALLHNQVRPPPRLWHRPAGGHGAT